MVSRYHERLTLYWYDLIQIADAMRDMQNVTRFAVISHQHILIADIFNGFR